MVLELFCCIQFNLDDGYNLFSRSDTIVLGILIRIVVHGIYVVVFFVFRVQVLQAAH